MSVDLSAEQERIVQAALDFVHSSQGPQHICISGYAGTGKTTVMGSLGARLIKATPKLAIAWCAPTGKAASVLRGKLKDFEALNSQSLVHTVHGHIYNLRGVKDGKFQWGRKQAEFPYDLIIVDEASMVTRQMFRDLLSYKKKVIFVGDAGQLPPVGDEPFPDLQATELRLVTVQRQALENPIIRMATLARNGEPIPHGSIGQDFCKLAPRSNAAMAVRGMFLSSMLEKDVMILCARNKTRQAINRIARTTLGFSGDIPNKHERLLCLRNERSFGVYNGQVVSVGSACAQGTSNACYRLVIENGPALLAYSGALFAQDGSEIRTRLAEDAQELRQSLAFTCQDEVALFDYGYALSVHKAQGSEWDAVLLYDERMSQMSDQDYARWLYTGITRAKNKLCIIG